MDRQFKRRIVFGVTTGGLLAGGGLGFAHADAAAPGGTAGGTHDSPGILSGNSIQIPVDVPINVCGVTADVIGLLNPAAGNDCSNAGGATATTQAATAGTPAASGAVAQGGTHGSPGIGSGNNVQIPINVPVNVCGDTVNVVGVHNPAVGNHCANHGGNSATASGGASDSPGILSGNNVQIPVNVPVNVCGDTVNVVGLLNPAVGNDCANGAPGTPTTPPPTTPSTPCPPPTSPTSPLPPPPPPTSPTTPTTPPTGPTTTPTTGTTGQVGGQTPGGTLAHTGAEGLILGPIGAALVGGGTVLYRRTRKTGSH